MSRTSLHRPRRPRAVWDRPATGTRLLPNPPFHPPSHHNPHYKRCPKAHRLRLRSDQSPSRPVHVTGYGRSPDKSRHALSKGLCQVRAPLTRRIRFASSGDAPEHSVMSPPWAIAPPPDSPGLDLAGESEQSDERRLKTNAPFTDSTVVTTGELPVYERRSRVHAPIPWDGRALLVVETAPHRDFLASPPHPLRSTGLSQSRRRCGTSAVADNTHRYRRRRLPAQPSGTFHPLPLPGPLNPGKSGLFPQNNQTSRLGPRINQNSPIHTHQRNRPTAHTLNPSPHNQITAAPSSAYTPPPLLGG